MRSAVESERTWLGWRWGVGKKIEVSSFLPVSMSSSATSLDIEESWS